jgi:hypothetical protein
VWVYIPPPILEPTPVSSPASADSTMLSPESFGMLSQSCTWRTKSLPVSGWQRKWKQESSLRRLFGPTLRHSQSSCSEAVQTGLSAGFPVRTSALPASEPASTESEAAYSSDSLMPLAHWDAATSLWRTFQPSLLGTTLTPFSGSWPTSGLLLDGVVFVRPTLARLMAGIAGGASRGTESNWPTITVGDSESGQTTPSSKRQGGAAHESLRVVASTWPTPNATVANDGETPETWRTRQAVLATKGYNGNVAGVPLAIAAQEVTGRLWSTPSVADTMGGHLSRGGDRSGELLLRGQARELAQRMDTERYRITCECGTVSEMALDQLCPGCNRIRSGTTSPIGPRGRKTEKDGPPSSPSTHTSLPQLNPLFVEWLMMGRDGIGTTCICPVSAIETTGSEDSETPSSSIKRKPRSVCSGGTPSVSGRREAV